MCSLIFCALHTSFGKRIKDKSIFRKLFNFQKNNSDLINLIEAVKYTLKHVSLSIFLIINSFF